MDQITGFEDQQLIQLADGWTAKRLYRGNIRDAYLKFGQHGNLLPEHQHPQVEHLYVLSGELLAQIEDENGEMQERHMVPGDGTLIPGRRRHSLRAKGYGDVIAFAAFEPPLSI